MTKEIHGMIFGGLCFVAMVAFFGGLLAVMIRAIDWSAVVAHWKIASWDLRVMFIGLFCFFVFVFVGMALQPKA